MKRPRGKMEYVPLAPFRQWLQEQMDELQGFQALAGRTGLGPRTVSHYIKGLDSDWNPTDKVLLEAVDVAFTTAGHPELMHVFYPEQAGEVNTGWCFFCQEESLIDESRCCLWCRSKCYLSAEQHDHAKTRFEHGESIQAIANSFAHETPYAHPKALANALWRSVNREGWSRELAA